MNYKSISLIFLFAFLAGCEKSPIDEPVSIDEKCVKTPSVLAEASSVQECEDRLGAWFLHEQKCKCLDKDFNEIPFSENGECVKTPSVPTETSPAQECEDTADLGL